MEFLMLVYVGSIVNNQPKKCFVNVEFIDVYTYLERIYTLSGEATVT